MFLVQIRYTNVMHILIIEISGAGIASSNGAILDEFSEKQEHQSTKTIIIINTQLYFYGANKEQI